MLVVRKQQLAALTAAAEQRFLANLCAFVAERSPSVAADQGEAQRMVEAGVARARGHGLREQRAIALFVMLMFEQAPNFDEHPRVAELLAAPGGSPEARLRRVAGSITEAEWAAVRAASDPSAWQPPPLE
jgi:hypothetical protein